VAIGCGSTSQSDSSTHITQTGAGGDGGMRLVKVGDFDRPLYVAQPSGEPGDLYIVEQCGRIMLVRDGEPLAKPFLDIGRLVTCGGEQGLLSMAFAPDFARSGRFYVDYTDTNGDTRVVEYGRDPEDGTRADPASSRVILAIEQPFSNHNGGQLQFGLDGLLYVGLGDGGSEGDPDRTAQDPGSALGKILRIDPSDEPGGYEIFASGLRNPWRFSFDRQSGALWIGDVGGSLQEEVDGVAADRAEGANFGWSAYEGTQRFNRDQHAPDAVFPVLTYPHADGACAVTGGYVVRDRSLPSLYGRYVYGDYCDGQLRSFTARPGRHATDDSALGVRVPSLSSFGEDAAGHLYAVSLEGPVYRLAPAGSG
jgi:glucose/arabinose dehydrogenase